MTRRFVRLTLLTALRLCGRSVPTAPLTSSALAVVATIAEAVIVTVAYVVVAAILFASTAVKS